MSAWTTWAAGGALLIAAGVGAGAAGGDCPPAPSAEVVLENRSCALWIAGSPHSGGDPQVGRFRIDAPGERASYRFTAPVSASASAVWVHVKATSLPRSGRMRASLRADVNGLPAAGASLPAGGVFDPRPGWQRVPLGQEVALERCDVYHVLVEPHTPEDFDGAQFVELATLVSRYPIAYQAEDPSTPEQRSFFDLELAFMFQDQGDLLLSRWAEGDYVFRPLFAVESSTGVLFGQPYDRYLEPRVLGRTLHGQRFTLSTPSTVNHVTVFARSLEGGDDQLRAEIHDPTLPAEENPIARGIVVPNPPSALLRAHWFGGVLRDEQGAPVELALEAREYILALRSVPRDQRATGFLVSMLESTLPLARTSLDPTYGGASSHAVHSFDSGRTFLGDPSGPDLSFVLARLAHPATQAVGINDEGVIHHADGKPALVARPGDTLQLRLVTRNVGPVAARLAWDVVDPDEGVSLIDGPHVDSVATGSNMDSPSSTDSGAQHPLEVPAALPPGARWRILMRVGHVDPLTQALVFDDEVPWEIRIR